MNPFEKFRPGTDLKMNFFQGKKIMIFLLFGFSRFYLIHSGQVGENNPKSGIKDLRSQRSSQTKPNFSSQGEEPRKQVIFSAIESDSEKLGLDFETFCTICFQIFFSLTKK